MDLEYNDRLSGILMMIFLSFTCLFNELISVVWNIKSQSARLVKIIPSDSWGGAGLLGVTIRLDNYAGAEDRLVRVLSIDSPKSPAAIAGLVPEKDFLLGTTHQTLDSVNRLAAVLQHHEDEIVELYVYNTDEDLVRVVSLLPTSNWEGSRGGLLGAEVGTGYLHRLPYSSRSTTGSSVERKVCYVEADQKNDSVQNIRAINLVEGENGAVESPTLVPVKKVLQMEPQLEMEPGDDEDHGGRRPLQSPSDVGIPLEKTNHGLEVHAQASVQVFTPTVSSGVPNSSPTTTDVLPPPPITVPTHATTSNLTISAVAPTTTHESIATRQPQIDPAFAAPSAPLPEYLQPPPVTPYSQSNTLLSVPSTYTTQPQSSTYAALPPPPQPYSSFQGYTSSNSYGSGSSFSSNQHSQPSSETSYVPQNPSMYYSQTQQTAPSYGYMNRQPPQQTQLNFSGGSV